MLDWLVEVTSAYKCAPRTYYLAAALFDNYLRACVGSLVLEDKDVHLVGIGALFLASKSEDPKPICSRVLSKKISHSAYSPDEILKMHKMMIM